MPKLANKIALITGAAGEQGTAEAELFVREGAAVILTDIDAAKGEALATRLSAAGGRALFRVQDAANEQSWQEIVAATLTAFGGLHILTTMPARSPARGSSARRSRHGTARLRSTSRG